MKLSEYLLNEIKGGIVSITGSGGKTSLMILLAQKAKKMGFSVLMSTTTKLAHPNDVDYQADYYYLDEKPKAQKSKICFWANTDGRLNKAVSPDLEVIEEVSKNFDYVFLEADGSRKLPLKLHREKDPVVLKSSTATICITSLVDYGKKTSEENFFYLTKEYENQIIDEKLIQKLLIDAEGIKKRAKGKTFVLINRTDKKVEGCLSVMIQEDKLYENI